MTQAASLPGALDSVLLQGTVVLTPTQRVARTLLRQFDRARQSDGATAWQSPSVFAWNAWTENLWQDALIHGVESRVLLNSLQEKTLWRGVIAKAGTAAPAHLRLCRSAIRLLGTYDVESRYTGIASKSAGLDAQTFVAWYTTFEERCSALGCLPAAFAELELARLILGRKLGAQTGYLLYGFDSLSPAQEYLVSALRIAGADFQRTRSEVPWTRPGQILRCSDRSAQLEACADWARQSLLANPGAELAIVVPGLEDTRPELERELRAAIAPELCGGTPGEQQVRYEFSTGRKLNRLPMIADALGLLRWCAADLPVEEAGALLRSPHLALAPSPGRGAELDSFVLLKATALRGRLSLRSAAQAVRKADESTAHRLNTFALAAESAVGGRATFADHTAQVRRLLEAAGWPGPERLSSEEYQATERWNEVLDRLATLDLFGNKPSFAEALAELDVVSGDMLFAPENTGASVQIIDLTDAIGSTADALWMLHADENALRHRNSMHPFLPASLQRELRMPGTSTALDEEQTRLALHNLAKSAPEVTFSYAATTMDGTQRLSPVLEALAANWSIAEVDSKPRTQQKRTPLLVTVEDLTPLPSLPPGAVHGGVGVVTAVAQCPFRAFAEHRLFSASPGKLEAGYSAADRGDHVHTVLRAFWSEVKDHATLKTYATTFDQQGMSQRNMLLKELIGALYRVSPDAWEEAYLQTQRDRLFRLLSAWLDLEAGRPAFRVESTEEEMASTQLGPLLLNLRIDRVDAVSGTGGENQAKLLIDYKTGPAEPRDWLGPRPDAPQLPVYAVAAGVDGVKALAFARVTARDKTRCLTGRGTDDNPFAVKVEEAGFSAMLETWREDLGRLAAAFAQGDISVDPKEYPKTCEYCAQRMLCRIEARRPTELDDDPADDVDLVDWQ